MTPVVNLRTKIIDENKPKELIKPRIIQHQPVVPIIVQASTINEWEEFLSIEDEYNPSVPNEYEKIVKERRERNKKEDNRKRQHRSPSPSPGGRKTGFGGAPTTGFGGRQSSDDEESFRPAMGANRGTAIAPPKSLQAETSPMVDLPRIANVNSYGASAVAAKIMAKYGFKDGQGLGKQEQGISMALQVEKTSKRGGRIIHEKEIGVTQSTDPQPAPASSAEQSITEMMKAPSQVIMLRNMVGPGEVDDELEPEVKEECNRKYGEVITVHIVEMPNVSPEETVRIFVEFTRIESAIKALVDLNGRFFGGE